MSKILKSEEGNLIELTGVIKAKSEKALLFFDGGREVWLPLSQIEDMQEDGNGGILLYLPEWLAIGKGLV